MNKRLLAFVCAMLTVMSLMTISVFATETDGADKIHTLFGVNGGFIVENPVDTSGTTGNPWLLIGKDVFMTDGGNYPAAFNNDGDKASFYYTVGSNSEQWLQGLYKDCLAEDFVIETTINYSEDSSGYVAVALAYNYDRYIEVYVSPDGRGDIAIDIGDSYISMLDGSAILDRNDPTALITALGGESRALPKTLTLSIKVTLDENRMPRKIDVYVNGLFVGTTGAGFPESVENLTPKYDSTLGGAFPKDKLGNIVALKFTSGAEGEIIRTVVYTLDKANPEPLTESQRVYAETFGNASFSEETEAVTEHVTEPEKTSDVEEDEYFDDDITALGIWMVSISVCIAAIMTFIILIIRKKVK